MADIELPAALKEAGSDYLKALRELDFEPQGLLWTLSSELYTESAGAINRPDWRLVIITSLIDTAGPLAMTELLFAAYNASALPQEISPFVVEIISSHSPFAEELELNLRRRGPRTSYIITPDDEFIPVVRNDDEVSVLLSPNLFNNKWVYFLNMREPKGSEQQRQWNSFKAHVEALAA